MDGHIIADISVDSVFQCGLHCVNDDHCLSFSYAAGTGNCVLHDMKHDSQHSILVLNKHYDYYEYQ